MYEMMAGQVIMHIMIFTIMHNTNFTNIITNVGQFLRVQNNSLTKDIF